MQGQAFEVIISAVAETSEIIRRRLFEWGLDEISPDGKIQLSTEAKKTCKSYAARVKAYKHQVPGWFPVSQFKMLLVMIKS